MRTKIIAFAADVKDVTFDLNCCKEAIGINGNCFELVLTLPENGPLNFEFYSKWHSAGTYDPADYNIKFYPNTLMDLTDTGYMFDEEVGKRRICALIE